MVRPDLAAFIITYNRPKILQHTIEQICRQTVAPSTILVVNNGEALPNSLSAGMTGIVIEETAMGSNIGPSGAANFALRTLSSRGFKWIQWIDDDDPPKVADLNERLFKHLENFRQQRIGVIAPVGSYFNTKRGVTVRVKDEELIKNQYLYLQTVGGNQCMLINSEVVAHHCLPTPELFFGFEETNFCLKVLNAGYQIVAPCDLFREYRSLASRWDLKRSDLRNTKIPLWRSYYSVRNLVYMFYFEFKKPGAVLAIIARSMMKALYGLRKPAEGFTAISLTLLGIKHGFTRRLGLTVKPVAKH